MIDIVAIIQKYMDMAISANVYYNHEHFEGGKIPYSTMLKDQFYAYKMGHKTLYYTNTPDGDESVDMKKNDDTMSNDSGCSGGACSI